MLRADADPLTAQRVTKAQPCGTDCQLTGCGLGEEAEPEVITGITVLFCAAVSVVLFTGAFALGVDAVRTWQQRKLEKQS